MNRFCLLFIMLAFMAGVHGQSKEIRLNLREALELGLENSPEIKKSEALINRARGRYWSGISLPAPEIGLSYEYIPSGKGPGSYSERSLSITQGVEFPTNYFLKAALAGHEEYLTVIESQKTVNSVRSIIKKSYYQVLAGSYRIKYLEENLEVNKDFLKKAEARYNLGEGTNLELLTARAQYTEAKNSLETAGHDLAANRAGLMSILGLSNRDTISSIVLTEQFSFDKTELTLEQIREWIRTGNKEIGSADLNRSIAGVEKKLAVSSLLPSFNISYFKQSRDGANGFYGLSAGISVPLWFPFEQRGRIIEAEADAAAAEYQFEQTKREVTMLANRLFADYQIAFHKAELYSSELLPQTMEIYQAAFKGYNAGELSYLEYLQAKQTRLSVQESYRSALLELNNILADIESVSGQEIKK